MRRKCKVVMHICGKVGGWAGWCMLCLHISVYTPHTLHRLDRVIIHKNTLKAIKLSKNSIRTTGTGQNYDRKSFFCIKWKWNIALFETNLIE